MSLKRLNNYKQIPKYKLILILRQTEPYFVTQHIIPFTNQTNGQS